MSGHALLDLRAEEYRLDITCTVLLHCTVYSMGKETQLLEAASAGNNSKVEVSE